MTLYLVIGVALFCLAFARLTGGIDRRYETAIALYVTLLAYVFSFIRWETGTDWPMYFESYGEMTSFAAAQVHSSWWGPGYSYLALLLNSLGVSYTVFLFCIATLLFSIKFHLLRVSCAAPLVALFVLFCVSFYDIFFVRQAVAVTFFWAFVYYYHHRRYTLAFSAALLAAAFHYSAALPIGLVMLLSHLKWQRVALLGLPLLGVIYYVATHVDPTVLLVASGLNGYVSGDFTEEKASSLSTTFRAYIKLSYWLFVIAVGYLSFLRRADPESDSDWTAFCLKCASGIVVLTALLVPVSEIFARLPEYAAPLFAVVLANYQFRMARMTVGGFTYLAVLLLLFIQLGFLYSAYPDLYYPIKTILG
jgi:hypothetical protein